MVKVDNVISRKMELPNDQHFQLLAVVFAPCMKAEAMPKELTWIAKRKMLKVGMRKFKLTTVT